MGDARHVSGTLSGVGVTDARKARLAESGLIAAAGPGALDVRTGVMAGPGSTAILTGTSTTGQMTVQINTHVAVTSRGSSNGVYLGPVLEAPTTVNIAAAPGSGSRIDVVYVKQQDGGSGVPSPDATTAPLYGVVTGTAGSSPAKPSVAAIAGAEELGTVQVFAGATSTNGANVTISTTARQTVARGARIPVRNQAERDALTLTPGLEVFRIDTGDVELNAAGASSSGWAATTSGMKFVREGFALAPTYAAAFSATGNVLIKASNFSGTTSAAGALTVPFASPFPNGVLTVVPAGVTNVTQPALNGRSAITKSGFTLICFGPTGAALASTAVDVTYLAIGW